MDRKTHRVCQILDAKDTIEHRLAANGIEVDAQCREAIGWTLKALIEDSGLETETAVEKVIAAYRLAA